MKNITLKLAIIAIIFSPSFLKAQIFTNGGVPAFQFTNNNAFMEAATNFDTDVTGSNINGKGFVFPRTDLTNWSFLTDDLDLGFIPTSYGGMVVYNTGTGSTPTTGNNPTTSTAVTPGFYYFSNPTIGAFDLPSITDGQWLPLAGGGFGAYTILQNTPTDTHLINAVTDQELVIQLAGTADGTTTFIDLGTTNLAASAVKQFRRADVYDGTGKLVFSATGDYDILTNVFVTGNGMFNLTLLTATYNVELY
jgi:hypothetical protein